MNKKHQVQIVAIFFVFVGVIAFAPNFVAAQDATATPIVTDTNTPTIIPSTTPTISTPTVEPTDTPAPTFTPVDTQTPAPTPYSVEDIHSEFNEDFENIDIQLTAIYDQVYSPPGASLVENIFANILSDMIKPSATANSRIYLFAKIFGSFSVVVKLFVVAIRIKNKESKLWKNIDFILGVVVFIYAALFVLLLFYPQVFEGKSQVLPSRDTSLARIENQLSDIEQYLKDHTISPFAEVPTESGNVEIIDMEIQLADIAKQLNDIKSQDQQSTKEIIDEINKLYSNIDNTRSIAAKRGWLGFNTLLLMAILGLLIYSRLENP